MIFNSVTYLLFLILAVLMYWILPKRAGLLFLFLGSIVFYGFWKFEFVPLLLIAAILDFWCSIQIENTIKKKTKLLFLILSLSINLGILFYFKYLVFFSQNIAWVLTIFGYHLHVPALNIILPLGISFYTFETISYTVDVYRGHIKAERNFLTYATFLVYFPHLIAGPVLRASEILSQLRNKKKFELEYLIVGFKRVLQGLFLKVVLADNIAPFVDAGFQLDPSGLSAIDVLTLAFMFGFQIYFDFAGYSHIAIGSAKMMGINFPENFNFPYFATSFKDFWKRWHISLSSWIRDYLYLPIMKTKVVGDGSTGIGNVLNETQPKRNKNIALFLTWAIMGLWHGANWTFVFWGIYHAALVFIERQVNKIRKLKNEPGLLMTFFSWTIVIPAAMLGWIFFRAENIHIASQMLFKLFHPSEYVYLGMRENNYIICFLIFILSALAFLYVKYVQNIVTQYNWLATLFNIIAYTFIIFLVFTFLRPINQFIYFQF